MAPDRYPVLVTSPNPQGGQQSQVAGFAFVPSVGERIRVGQNLWRVEDVTWLTPPVERYWEPVAEVTLSTISIGPTPEQQRAQAAEEAAAKTTPNRQTRRAAKRKSAPKAN